jgi:hypothetical protein
MSESPPKTQGEEHGVVQSPVVGEEMDGANDESPEGKLQTFKLQKMSESPPKTQGEEHGVVQSPIVGEHMDGTNAQYPEGYGQNVKEHDRWLTASGTLSSDSLRKRL